MNVDRQLLEVLTCDEPLAITDIPLSGDLSPHLDRLVMAYRVLRIVRDWRVSYIATEAWIPEHILHATFTRAEARLDAGAEIHALAWSGDEI